MLKIVLGQIGYNFEPDYSTEELDELESIATGLNGEVAGDDNFCQCLNSVRCI